MTWRHAQAKALKCVLEKLRLRRVTAIIENCGPSFLKKTKAICVRRVTKEQEYTHYTIKQKINDDCITELLKCQKFLTHYVHIIVHNLF